MVPALLAQLPRNATSSEPAVRAHRRQEPARPPRIATSPAPARRATLEQRAVQAARATLLARRRAPARMAPPDRATPTAPTTSLARSPAFARIPVSPVPELPANAALKRVHVQRERPGVAQPAPIATSPISAVPVRTMAAHARRRRTARRPERAASTIWRAREGALAPACPSVTALSTQVFRVRVLSLTTQVASINQGRSTRLSRAATLRASAATR